MRVFRWHVETQGYLGLIPRNSPDNDLLSRVGSGVSLLAQWYPISMEFNHEFEKPGENTKVGDLASSFSTRPILSRKAIDSLQTLLERHGEVLPLDCTEGDYFVFNPLTVVDALDLARSRIEYLPSGRIWDMGNRYCFHENLLEGVAIFLLPQLRSSIFVTDAFVSLVHGTGLSGFRFPRVWDSADQMN